MKRILILSTALALLASCQQGGSQGTPNTPNAQDSLSTPETPRTQATQDNSQPDFQTMGKVIASRFADVKFEASLPILRVLVHNGDRVRQGQLLAELNPMKMTDAIEQHQREVEQARLQMEDVVISQGYDPEVPDQVPQQVRLVAEVKSGLQLAQSRLAAARHELKAAKVVAPFDGVVANVTARAGQLAQTGETVCRIISQQQMDVEFQVMESDLVRFPVGSRLQIVPVADEGTVYEARVAEVNPIVDEHGTIAIRARVASPNRLFDGMHVSVNINAQKP